MNVHVELTVWCEAIRPGCTFTAKISEGAHALFYAGQGDTAFEAIAWALDEYVRRALLGMSHSMARPADARPGEGLAARTDTRRRSITPAPPIAPGPELAQDTGADNGCFERVIPTSPAPRLFSLASPIATPSPTTRPRSARGARR